MKIRFLLAALSLCLTGCMTTAVVSSATVGGGILYDKRNISAMLSDRHTNQTASNLIASNDHLKGRSNLTLNTFNRITLITGQAQTNELKQLATTITAKVPGVARVYNQSEIAGATSDLQRTNDAWLTAKVKSSLLRQVGINSTQVKVITDNNVVFLMGEVSRSEGQKLADDARRVAGVTKVVKVFQYIR